MNATTTPTPTFTVIHIHRDLKDGDVSMTIQANNTRLGTTEFWGSPYIRIANAVVWFEAGGEGLKSLTDYDPASEDGVKVDIQSDNGRTYLVCDKLVLHNIRACKDGDMYVAHPVDTTPAQED